MALDLLAVSSFGWYTDETAVDVLDPVKAHGWFFDFVVDDAIVPDTFCFDAYVHQVHEIQVCK